MKPVRLSHVDHRVPLASCPLCGHKLDAASGVGADDIDDRPTPGDYGICINCATPLVYKDDLTVRALSAPEMAAMHPENRQEIEAAMRAIRKTDRR